MKQKITINRLLHNEKLMILVSLVLAIIIWAGVVYGPGNDIERVLTGVPVSIKLNDYASQTLNLQIVDGGDATATVTVSGTRSVISKLSARDIQLTADTGNVIKEGTYVLQLRAVPSGDFSIVSIVGDDGNNSTVTITCDVWREQLFPVKVTMPDLAVSDPEKYQFGTPSISGDAVSGSSVTVSGPKSDIDRIDRVEAMISERRVVSETSAFSASLTAYDKKGKEIETISFVNAEDAKIDVTVPVMEYHKLKLEPVLKNVPKGYEDRKDLVSVTPSEIEFWSVPSETEDYVAKINELLVVDFDQLNPENLTRETTLKAVDGVRLVNSSETIKVKVNLYGIYTRTLVDVPLSKDNFRVENCPDEYTVKVEQNRIPQVLICGPYYIINRIKAEDIVLVVDLSDEATVGQQVVKARLQLDEDTAWVNYGDEETLDVQIVVTKKK